MTERFQMSHLYVLPIGGMVFVDINMDDANEKINKIYDDFEAQLQAKEKEISNAYKIGYSTGFNNAVSIAT